MSSELVPTTGAGMAKEIQWANRLAGSELLPGQYRNRPANLIWAAEYAKSLNLHPMTAVTGIYVIDGKPTASGALISALVRRAGHKLRVMAKTTRATVQIIRHDDPDFIFEVTWELKGNPRDNPNAQDAALLAKQNWVKYPAAMLTWRALTHCARQACEEALLGVHYTPEEINPNIVVNEDGHPVHVERMQQTTFEDMLAPQIERATSMDTLAKLHQDASLAGVLENVPTSELERGGTNNILTLLNRKAKEITDAGAKAESQRTGGGEDSSGEREETTGDSREESGEQSPEREASSEVTDGVTDAEVVDAEVLTVDLEAGPGEHVLTDD